MSERLDILKKARDRMIEDRDIHAKVLKVGTVNIWEVPGYRTEMSPFGGIKDSGNGTKEGVVEAMKAYTNLKTFSLPWAG